MLDPGTEKKYICGKCWSKCYRHRCFVCNPGKEKEKPKYYRHKTLGYYATYHDGKYYIDCKGIDTSRTRYELEHMGFEETEGGLNIDTEGTGTPLVVGKDNSLRVNGVRIGRIE